MRAWLFVVLLLPLGCVSPSEDASGSAALQADALLRAASMYCLNGKYASAEGGGGGEVYCNRDDVREWEQFTLVDLGGNWYAIQTLNGSYLRALDGGGGDVDARARSIDSWERWKLGGGGVVGFAASDGIHYLSVGGGGRLHARATEFTDSETFILTALSNVVVF